LTPTWAKATTSPTPLPSTTTIGPREAKLLAACGTPDAALMTAAQELAKQVSVDPSNASSSSATKQRLRTAGAPYVYFQLIVASGQAPAVDASLVSTLRTNRDRRCGVGLRERRQPDGPPNETIVALYTDPIADLAPFPTQGRVGQALAFDARMLVPFHAASIVILGPRGTVRHITPTVDLLERTVRARVLLAEPGGYLVQLVATLDHGPKPVLEAHVFADAQPFALEETTVVPGEDAAALPASDSTHIATGDAPSAPTTTAVAMVNAARHAAGLPNLERHPVLDRLAQAHADNMRAAQRVAHDLGRGTVQDRVSADGALSTASLTRLGENVAHATSLSRAHRALYMSPSHRANLVDAQYTHIGVGIAEHPDGGLYICEILASFASLP